jgi:hypothetical protein
MPYGVIVPPSGDSDEFGHHIWAQLLTAAGDAGPAALRQKHIFFLGFIRYADIFKNVYTLGFCFLFDTENNRWILAGGPEYNYCCKENQRPPAGISPQPTHIVSGAQSSERS